MASAASAAVALAEIGSEITEDDVVVGVALEQTIPRNCVASFSFSAIRSFTLLIIVSKNV